MSKRMLDKKPESGREREFVESWLRACELVQAMQVLLTDADEALPTVYAESDVRAKYREAVRLLKQSEKALADAMSAMTAAMELRLLIGKKGLAEAQGLPPADN